MCGFAGEFLFSSSSFRADVALAQKMAERLAHRGPDEQGSYLSSDGRCAIGFRRLSVIDLAGSHQPMSSEDGRVTLAFNGEIYNFRLLRLELERQGHQFRTHGDTEVLLAMYLREGMKMLDRLEGMFALAIHDARENRLHLVRDRLGVKPLWLAVTSDRVIFASEAKALLAHPQADRTVNLDALGYYLKFGYVPAPQSIWKGLQKLPPGHAITFSTAPDAAAARAERWWQPPAKVESGITREEAAARAKQLLLEAVTKRLLADVPLGAMLSGGIDSSIVAALMCQATGEPRQVKTFSVGFREEKFDERPYAKAVAQHLGTSHHEFVVESDSGELIDTLVRQYDEPFADSSALPTYLLCRAVRGEVTVALVGDGGDEAFAGYDRHRAMWLRQSMGPLKSLLVTAGGVLADSFASPDEKSPLRRFARFAKAIDAPPALQYLQYRQLFSAEQMDALLTDDLADQLALADAQDWFADLYEQGECESELQLAQRCDMLTYLPDDLLVKADIASMAHGLELRSPFLDHKVLEFGLSLPDEFKVNRRQGKVILREAFRDLLPEEVFHRPKAGFGLPIDSWLRGPLLSLLKETLLDQSFIDVGWFKRTAMERLIQEHASGKADHRHRLWALLWLGRWQQGSL